MAATTILRMIYVDALSYEGKDATKEELQRHRNDSRFWISKKEHMCQL